MIGRFVSLVSLLCAAAVACSSSGTRGDAGARQDAEGPGDGAAGQASGESGRAGSTGESAGAPSGGSTGSGGTTGSTTLDATEVCRQALRVQAERATFCQDARQELFDEAMGLANACPDAMFNPDSNRTVEGMAACLPALRARTCTDVSLGIMPACFPIEGKRLGDTSCAFSSQCKSGLCNGGDNRCGTCQAREKQAGEACQDWHDCLPGLHCNSQGVCASNGTPVYASEGEPCDLDGTPVVGCAGDLSCRFDAGSRAGICTARPGAGQPCGHGFFTTETLCTPDTTCVFGTCRSPGGCGDGVMCDADSYCESIGTRLQCSPRAKLGEGCSVGPGGRPCLSPGVCLRYTKCVIPRTAGQSCDDDNPCDRYLLCQRGTCQKMNLATCPP